jgi:hypothetical protein
VSEPDGFLTRWSRRKQEARHEELSVPEEALAPADPQDAVEAEPETPQPELPPVESITAETDISVFLAKGVADSIRNAALRRMWSLDPAIRDFVGDARDYAYDWNTPGGVPGFGPIEASYDVEGTIARMFGRAEQPGAEELAIEEESKAEEPSTEQKPIETAASETGAADPTSPTDPEPATLSQTVADAGPMSTSAAEPSTILAKSEPARVNTPRHGRATPV